MAFKAYLTTGFQHHHENDMFAVLVDKLMQRFGEERELHVIIGNVLFEGNDIDAVFLNPNAICIVEMKAHGGKVHFTESTPWRVGTSEVRGGSKRNPFEQVRAYRLGLKNFFRNQEREILQASRFVEWNHISAVVLFGQEVEFDHRMLGGLRSWFGVTDLPRIADHLARLRTRDLRLNGAEIQRLLDLLGLDDRYLYAAGEIEKGSPLQASPTPVLKSLQLVYLKEFGFRDHESRVRNHGGLSSAGAQHVRQLFEQVRQGQNPFLALPSRKDSRVQGATIYIINNACELLLIEKEVSTFPAFLGNSAEVQGWLSAHEGQVITVDVATGRFSVTTMLGEANAAKIQPQALTTDVRPLLTQISGLELENLVPQRKIREQLLQLDEISPEQEIIDTLEMIADPDVRTFLVDITSLLRGGDHAGAEARLHLRLGTAVPINDAGRFAQDAAASGTNSDQVLVINDLSKEDLNRLLDPHNFHEWMLFLHPDQKSLSEAEFDRPVVLTGVSGSGKTCILVHRARHLARKYPEEKVGILTLSRTLAGLLQNLVNRLLTEEERRNVFVRAFYDVFRDCLSYLGPDKYFIQLENQVGAPQQLRAALTRAKDRWPNRMVWNCDPISKVRVEDEWEEFYMSHNPELMGSMDGLVKYLEDNRVDASRYLEEEFALIRSQFTVPSRARYLDTEEKKIRAGRAIQFRKQVRQDALRVLLLWEEWLIAGGMIDDLGLTQALMPLHSEMQNLPRDLKFRCLLVDEFQDFSTLDLQLFRRMVPITEPDALFLAGDTVQKILVKRQSLRDAGLDSGAAIYESILKNYRNSKQVLLAASRLANHYGAMAKAQEEEVEVLDPELAQRETNPPIVIKTDDQISKAWEIALECTQGNKTEPWTVCIATAAPRSFPVSEILLQRPVELGARSLSGDCILHPEEVVVGTISDLKGFEFRLVLILGCDADNFPEVGVPRDEVWRDALRLYVAMTRGRDQVYLLHGEKRSEFIRVLGDTVLSRAEPVLKPYIRAEKQEPVVAPSTAKSKLKRPELNWDENSEGWFDVDELEALKRYFARHVYRDNLTFHEWMKPRGLQQLEFNLFRRLKNVSGKTVTKIFKRLRAKGVIFP